MFLTRRLKTEKSLISNLNLQLTELMVLHSLAQFSFYVCKKVTVILEGQA